MTIEYRDIYEPEDIERAVDLEAHVWQMEDRQVVPASTMIAMRHAGGHIGGAFDGQKLVGFSLALVGRREREVFLWSHMTAVDPAYQTRKIGYGLKQAQRTWAMQHNFAHIRWTFDPLLRVNANFNLRRLGAMADRYHVNIYGLMNDAKNRGMPSDRLEVSWELASARVVEHASADSQPVLMEVRPSGYLLRADEHGHPQPDEKPHAAWHFIELPYDIDAVKRQDMGLALAWRMATREAFLSAFAQGYSVVDFVNAPNRCWYVLFGGAS